MDTQIWTVIAAIASGLLVPVVGAIGIWGQKQVKRWQAKTDLKTMQENAKSAVAAVEQLYPNEPNETKAKLAMEWAQKLNCTAGIDVSDKTQLILNEANVLPLPKTKPDEAVG
jgi:hypothetical protein